MATKQDGSIVKFLKEDEAGLIERWIAASGMTASAGVLDEAREIFGAFRNGLEFDDGTVGIDGASWGPVKSLLETLSASRAAKGLSLGETSAFVLSIKMPIFEGLQKSEANSGALIKTLMKVTTKVDAMAQWTATTFQRAREEVIARQQQDLLELSTPVIKLWDGVLAVPMIGTLDSNRTQMVMEALLQKIVDTESALAIIDITGVPTVDTLVAQHLLKTVTAIRLMGADCIISGIRPQIAQTIVHLGIDLQSVTTKATLADALALAMKMTGYTFSKTS
ncbi:MAG: STAS domain-containing protein [Burkholderiaceae bacterium]